MMTTAIAAKTRLINFSFIECAQNAPRNDHRPQFPNKRKYSRFPSSVLRSRHLDITLSQLKLQFNIAKFETSGTTSLGLPGITRMRKRGGASKIIPTMKCTLKFLLGITAVLGLPVICQAGNVTITRAEITRIVKDVKTVDPSSKARPAVLKETIKGNESVRTGIDSRTELLFNDHTITRLGANTHFSFTEGTREMSLGSGALLLQVPKGIGGAQINMPAVTAGITGTTILLETQKTYTKLIVLEGQCCLWRNADKRRKVCAKAGQEVLLFHKMKDIPQPYYVDLKIIVHTSKLLSGRWGAPLDEGPITAAINTQGRLFGPGGPPQTGAGTSTIITQQLNPQTPPQSNPVIPPTVTTPPSSPPASGPPNGPLR